MSTLAICSAARMRPRRFDMWTHALFPRVRRCRHAVPAMKQCAGACRKKSVAGMHVARWTAATCAGWLLYAANMLKQCVCRLHFHRLAVSGMLTSKMPMNETILKWCKRDTCGVVSM